MIVLRNIFGHFSSFSDTNNDTQDCDNNHNQISLWPVENSTLSFLEND